MTVRGILRRPVITVQESARLTEVVNKLATSRVSGSPVVNRVKRLPVERW